MKDKSKRDKSKFKNKTLDIAEIVVKITCILVIGLLLFMFGFEGGKTVYRWNVDIVNAMDTGYFKDIIDDAVPLVEICYNSGKTSVSFAGEVKNTLSSLFNADFTEPYTILNSQFAILEGYNIIRQQASEKLNGKIVIDNGKQFQGDTNKSGENNASHDGNKPPDGNNPIDVNKPPDGNNPIDMNKLPEGDNSIDGNKLPGGNEPKTPGVKPTRESSTWIDESGESGTDEGVNIEKIISQGKIEINNHTKLKIDINELEKERLHLNFNKKGPQVLIFHTHTTESYLRSLSANTGFQPSYIENPRYNVVRVGEELAWWLKRDNGIGVIHNGTNHMPTSGAYKRSMDTVSKILKSYPSIKIVLDIHRDGLSARKKMRVFEKINGRNAADIMFVMGTDQMKLDHPNWRENLKLAIKLQEKLNKIAPGLARPIDLRRERFNEHLSEGALLIEIGGDGNTLDEAMESTKYLAKALGEIIKEYSGK